MFLSKNLGNIKNCDLQDRFVGPGNCEARMSAWARVVHPSSTQNVYCGISCVQTQQNMDARARLSDRYAAQVDTSTYGLG